MRGISEMSSESTRSSFRSRANDNSPEDFWTDTAHLVGEAILVPPILGRRERIRSGRFPMDRGEDLE